MTATDATPANVATLSLPAPQSPPSPLTAETQPEDSVLGPLAAEPALAQARRRAAGAALLLDAFPAPLQPAAAVGAAGGPLAVAAAATDLAAEDTAGAAHGGRGHQDASQPSVEHELLLPPPPGGEGGGSGGGAAAAGGASGGSSSAAASALVAPVTQKAPAAVRVLAFLQPSWRTSFFVLIPERPD